MVRCSDSGRPTRLEGEPAVRPARGGLLRIILVLTLVRLVTNAGRRFAYPFLPEIARDLHTTLPRVQAIVALQGGVGLLSPLCGPLAERHGRKVVMVAALLLTTIVFGVAMLLLGAGKMAYDPALQAYLGDRVAYARRGLVLGLTELSWAGALLLGAPLAGWLLATGQLRAVFLVLAVLLLGSLVLVRFLLPADRPLSRVAGGRGAGRAGAPARVGPAAEPRDRIVTPAAAWRLVRSSRPAIAALAFSFLLVAANEIFLINYGAWLEAAYHLSLTSLGLATLVVGAAEITGEFLVVLLADRFGKRRLALWGGWTSSLAYLALPLLSRRLDAGLGAGLVGLFLLFLCLEVAVVSSIPLFSEILPGARAVMMSGNVGAHAAGRLVGGLAGGALYALLGSFLLLGAVATITGLLAFLVLALGVQEQGQGGTHGRSGI
jgi:predicted MFS family arabinose efflux permease